MEAISDDVYRLLLLSPLGVVIHDADGAVIAANQSFADLLGYTLDEVREIPAGSVIHPADVAAAEADAGRLISGEIKTLTTPRRLLHRDGSAVSVQAFKSSVVMADGRSCVMVQTVDLREEASRIAELEHAAAHDGLTGLLNRGALLDRMQRRLDRYRPMVVVLIDLDSFKSINDTYGHVVGDYVLQEVARRLAFVAPVDSLVSRLAGDEFVVACETANGQEVCAGIERTFELPVQLGNDRTVAVRGSCGWAVAPIQSDALDAIAAADQAMYGRKNQSRIPRQRPLGPVAGGRYHDLEAGGRERTGRRARLSEARGDSPTSSAS